MVKYNKKIINKKTIQLIKKKQKGGNLIKSFSSLHTAVQIIIIIPVAAITYVLLNNMYRWKLNGIIFPFVFYFIGYELYTILTYHTNKLGISLTEVKSDNKSDISMIIKTIKDIFNTIPKLVPIIPKIKDPTFNYQPFKGIREGIRSLHIPYKIKDSNYKLTINFPKLEIPFFDPLAGICCVWEKLEKLVKLVEKAMEVPKKIVERIFGGIKRAIDYIKNNVIKPILNVIKGLVSSLIYPVVGLLYVPVGFLEAISKFPGGGKVNKEKNKILDEIKKLKGFANPGLSGGGLYNKYKTPYEKNDINDYLDNYNGPHINDPFYKIEILEYEEIYKQKIAKRKISRMSIYKMYKIQNKRKNGLIKYVNAYKDYKFRKFAKKQFAKRKAEAYNFRMDPNTSKTDDLYYNSKIHDYMSDQEINEFKKNYNNILKYNSNKYSNIQYGGNPFKDLAQVEGWIRDLPNKINVICRVVKIISNGIRNIGRQIDRIARIIFGPIPEYIKKTGQLINYVGKLIDWFIKTIIGKGIRIIEAAIELVFNLTLGNLPSNISTKIFLPIKYLFKGLLLLLKLPFIEFFTTIVETLLDIPKIFNGIKKGLDGICIALEAVVRGILYVIIEPIKRLVEMAKKFNPFNGGSGLQKLLYKHNYELNIMLEKRYLLQQTNNTDKNYLDKLYNLDILIKEKKKRIKNIRKLLLKYEKCKQKQIKN